MTPLRQRMIQDMTLRNLSPHTVEAYVRAVAQFAQSFSSDCACPGTIDAAVTFRARMRRNNG